MQSKLSGLARAIGFPDAFQCPWHTLRYQHVAAIRTRLGESYSPNTANNTLSALKGVMRQCWRLGLLSNEEYTRAVDVKPVRGHRLPKGRALSREELRALFAVCSSDARGRRDACLLAVLAGGGLRRSEAVALDVADYQDGGLRVRAGKGNKERVTFLPPWAREAVEAWSECGKCAWAALDSGTPLLLPVNKGGRIGTRRLSAQSVLDILARLATDAGIGELAPHDMRRTFITSLLDSGVDIHTTAQLAGHSNIQTTARYDRRGDYARRKAVEGLTL